MTLHIQNMVSLRCKIMVRQVLSKLNIRFTAVELGFVETDEELTETVQEALQARLNDIGLALAWDRKTILAEKVKTLVGRFCEENMLLPKVKYSHFLSQRLNVSYNYLSKVFRDETGLTIERYIISRRIERVKELLQCHNVSLTEIAYRLNYSSVAHLSCQFKDVTGLCVTAYKSYGSPGRHGLEEICAGNYTALPQIAYNH